MAGKARTTSCPISGAGYAYEWVGWTDLTEPVTLTFTLPAGTKVSAVEIGLNHRDGLGIFVPSAVTINGVKFELGCGGSPQQPASRPDL